MVLTITANDICDKSLMKEESEKTFTKKCKYACILFHEICKFQKEGLLCDTFISSNTEEKVGVHRVVLESAKSLDSDYQSDSECMDSDNEENKLRCLSSSGDSLVFEEAYPSDDEIDDYQSSPIVSHSMEPLSDRLKALNELRQRGRCCDVTLQVSGVRYPAHRVVLAAASEYFRIMFTSGMKEQTLSCIELKIAEYVDVCQIVKVLDYVYTGDISLDDNNIFDILVMAAFFQISPLIEQCENLIIDQISNNNCCASISLAKTYALTKLLAAAKIHVHDNFPRLDFEEDQLEMLEEEDLLQHLGSDTLGGNIALRISETCVLNNVINWLSAKQYQDGHDLLAHVRFSQIPKQTIEACMNSCNPNLRTPLLNALEYHHNIYQQPLLRSHRTELRTNHKKWTCFDGVLSPRPVKLFDDSPRATLLCNNGKNGERQEIRDPFHNVEEVAGFVYVIGGTRSSALGYSGKMVRYSSQLDACVSLASMKEERGDFYSCVFENHIYVFGGRNKYGAMSSCERYSISNNEWEQIADLPEALYMMGGTIHDGYVYISGGFNDEDAVGSMFKYDPRNDHWEELPCRFFKDRGYHVMINDNNGSFWAIGGADNPFSGRNVWEVERFDVAECMWNYVGQVLAVQPFLSMQRLNGFLNEDGCIYVFAVTNTDHSSVMKYDPLNNLWQVMDTSVPFYEVKIDNA